MAQVQIPVSPLTRSGTMGRIPNLSAPQFLHLYNRDRDILLDCCEDLISIEFFE